MKIYSNLRRAMRGALAVLLFACLLIALVAPPAAKAQVTPTSINVATNILTSITTGVSSNITSYIPVVQGKGLNVVWRYALSGSGTENSSLYLYPRPDGTNIVTTKPWILTSAGNGTTQVVDYTNLTALQLSGIKDIAITVATNGSTRTLYLTNIVYTY